MARARSMLPVLAALLAAAGPMVASGQAPPPSGTSSALVDVVALDSSGRPVTSLAVDDFRVTVDGQERTIRSLRYVFRGPGAAAAAGSAGLSGGTHALSEPSRLVLLVVDENSIIRGGEKAVVSAAWRVLDSVGAADRVAVVALPVPRGQATLSTDRDHVRAALAGLAGRASLARELARTDELRPGEPDPLADDEPEREPESPGSQRPQRVPSQGRGTGAVEPTRETPAPEQGDTPVTSLQALALLLADLREIPGPKAVIYLWGGASGGEGRGVVRPDDPRLDPSAAIDAAAASRTSVHVVSLSRARNHATEPLLVRLARETGGTFARGQGRDTTITSLSAALSGAFLVEIETRADEWDGRVRRLEVRTARKGVALFAAGRWVPRDDPLPAAIETPAPEAARGTSPEASTIARAGAAAEARTSRPDPVLDAVLARVSEYLDGYLRDFSNVVVEEDYYQRVMAWNNRPRETVRLRSDLLLVRTGGPDGWVPFRDVFEVDNVPVRDREDRLRKLFLERPGAALAEARRITEESARHNIGPIERTVNVPTLPLIFLMPAHISAFRFERRREDTVEGLRVLQVDFEETGRPTVISDGKGGDRPSSGSLWIDPVTGRVVKTTLRNGDRSFRLDATVVYRRSESLGLWAPAQMTETYRMLTSRETVVGEAKYTNFRRFKVDTEVTIGDPKDEGGRRP